MDIPIKQTNDANARASKVRLVVFDVDGVLTSGQIAIGKDGEVMKEFFVQDGLGIAVTQRAGIKTAIITGRESEMVRLRSAELKICDVYHCRCILTEQDLPALETRNTFFVRWAEMMPLPPLFPLLYDYEVLQW